MGVWPGAERPTSPTLIEVDEACMSALSYQELLDLAVKLGVFTGGEATHTELLRIIEKCRYDLT